MKAGKSNRALTLTTAGAVVAWLLVVQPGAAQKGQPRPLFQTSDRCQACHNGLTTPGGESASIGVDWRPAMMANSGRDPYWRAAVRREVLDHPSARATIEDECSRCHLPMANFESKTAGEPPQLFAHLAAAQGPAPARAAQLAIDGVSCAACHQITPKGLGTRDSFTGHYDIDAARPWGQRRIYGPFEVDRGRTRVMQSASTMRPEQSAHVQQAELCASCHTLFTHALDAQGQVVGELPEQVPYLEWQHSAYRDRQACQSCHMPVVDTPMPIASVLGQPRERFSRHVFRGGNFFMMNLLGRYAADLGVVATPQELSLAALRTTQHLQSSSARLSLRCAPVEADRLAAEVSVVNLAGHKLPSAYPSRRAWLHFVVLDATGKPVFESGALAPDGSIVGNDNDENGARFEPHYHRISRPDEVQIYEPILGSPDGAVTTGLLTASQYLKDNRLLPVGFDKQSASADVAVHGRAQDDGSFQGGGDVVRYSVSVAGAQAPLRVRAELWYQPIGHRWAHNLGAIRSPESARFVGYYRSMAASSAVMLAQAEAAAPPAR
ncbi:MAG: hypothetical protein JRI23_22335 [Deltaproteobacteria bacterium]|nr:hypothetical protein [Deltaproteobacteria bacterium]MBW2534685.1 hypothetical protein [Deltaproteobacteria bacterium]